MFSIPNSFRRGPLGCCLESWEYITEAVDFIYLFILRKLKSFGVYSNTGLTRGGACIENAVLSAVICWISSITASDFKKLNRCRKLAGNGISCLRMIHKLENLMENTADSALYSN